MLPMCFTAGYVIAQANYYTGSNGPLISQPAEFDFSSIAVQPAAAVGQCALVNDTFDPNTFQALGVSRYRDHGLQE